MASENKNPYRLRKQEFPFTQVPNELVQSPEISGLAKSIWCYFSSRPDNWTFYSKEILKNFRESEKPVRRAIKELINFGYLIREKVRDDKGRFSHYDYILSYHSTPLTLDNSDPNPEGRNRPVENPPVENDHLIINKETNKEINLSQDRNKTPTFEEVDEEVKRRERENLIRKGFKTKEFYQWLVNNWDTLNKKSLKAQIYSASQKSINFEQSSTSKPLKPVRSLSEQEQVAIAWAKISGSFQIRNKSGGCSIDHISISCLKFDSGELFYEIDDTFPVEIYKDLFSSLKINLKKI